MLMHTEPHTNIEYEAAYKHAKPKPRDESSPPGYATSLVVKCRVRVCALRGEARSADADDSGEGWQTAPGGTPPYQKPFFPPSLPIARPRRRPPRTLPILILILVPKVLRAREQRHVDRRRLRIRRRMEIEGGRRERARDGRSARSWRGCRAGGRGCPSVQDVSNLHEEARGREGMEMEEEEEGARSRQRSRIRAHAQHLRPTPTARSVQISPIAARRRARAHPARVHAARLPYLRTPYASHAPRVSVGVVHDRREARERARLHGGEEDAVRDRVCLRLEACFVRPLPPRALRYRTEEEARIQRGESRGRGKKAGVECDEEGIWERRRGEEKKGTHKEVDEEHGDEEVFERGGREPHRDQRLHERELAELSDVHDAGRRY
ncbi:hypothetical protein FB451DRAFT_1448588 [Mycena latifolia]|nr:hypothetical protein FB451DRAFT_1448588 [Mycena latifolia]